MTTNPWYLQRLAGFDIESTGVDVESDRIVTACVVQCGGNAPVTVTNWLADPGIEIPAGASAVHGISTETARAEGRPAAEVVAEVVAALAETARDGIPIVAMNASFDLTMLDREARRYGVKGLFEYTDAVPMVIDPRVLDKKIDRFRRGGRTLTDLCAHYKVPLDGAHSADADAIAACRVAWRIGQRAPSIGDASLEFLHEKQVQWAAEQAESLAEYFRRTPGKEHQADGVRGDWPFVPFTAEGATS